MWHQRLIRSQKFYYIFVAVDLFLYIRLLRFAISVSRFYPPKRKKSKFMKISFIFQKVVEKRDRKIRTFNQRKEMNLSKKDFTKNLADDHEILYQSSCPSTSKQNAVTECKHRHIVKPIWLWYIRLQFRKE